MKPAARAALVALWSLVATAGAHAYLSQVVPGDDGVVAVAPEALELHFTMAIEARFSSFEVYRLLLSDDVMPADLTAPSERERQRLNALAAQLAARALAGDVDDDSLERADGKAIGLSAGNTVVTVGLREDLPAGVYLIAWEVLAVDTHWTGGHELLFVAGPLD